MTHKHTHTQTPTNTALHWYTHTHTHTPYTHAQSGWLVQPWGGLADVSWPAPERLTCSECLIQLTGREMKAPSLKMADRATLIDFTARPAVLTKNNTVSNGLVVRHTCRQYGLFSSQKTCDESCSKIDTRHSKMAGCLRHCAWGTVVMRVWLPLRRTVS